MWIEKHGQGWRIRDSVAGRKVTLGHGYPNKTVAKNAMAELRGAQLRGQALRPGGGRTTLAEWIAVWLPGWMVSLKQTSAISEPARIANHIVPLLGHLALADIETLTVQAWLAQLLAGDGPAVGSRRRRPLAVKTALNVHGLLYTIMQAAVKAKLIPANPCMDTALPKRPHHEMRFLTEPEIARLLSATPNHWRPLVLLLVSTGLRWGEAIALRIGDVDLLAKAPSARITRALTEMPGTAELVFHSPKTEKGRRTVTLGMRCAEVLTELPADRPGTRCCS